MTLAALKLSEILPLDGVPSAPVEALDHVQEAQGITPEQVEDARLKGYADGFQAGVAKTEKALADTNLALNEELSAKVAAHLETSEPALQMALRDCRETVARLLHECLPKAQSQFFADKLVDVLAQQIESADSQLLHVTVHPTQRDRVNAALAASNLSDHVDTVTGADCPDSTAIIEINGATSVFDTQFAFSQIQDALLNALPETSEKTPINEGAEDG